MTITDNELGLLLARVWFGNTSEWHKQDTEAKKRWYAVAAKARELLAQDENDLYATVTKPDPGPLQKGDIVSMRGVVERVDPYDAGVSEVRVGAAPMGVLTMLRNDDLTLIERPAPPEPDWQNGDVAQDEKGELYRYRGAGTVNPWVDLRAEPMPGGRSRFLCRAEIPGTLTPCDVVPRNEDSTQRIQRAFGLVQCGGVYRENPSIRCVKESGHDMPHENAAGDYRWIVGGIDS